MKNSIYNSIIKVSPHHTVIYNSLSDKFMIVPASVLSEDGVLVDQSLYPNTYKKLVDIGAIINSEVDEETHVVEFVQKYDNDGSILRIHVNPTLNCNFKCWYCYETHVADSKISPEKIKAVINYVKNCLEKNQEIKGVEFSFFGGEPLLYFKDTVVPIYDNIKLLCEERSMPLSLHFTTNGYLINEEMLDYFKINKASFQITLDGGKDFHNQVRKAGSEGSYEKILHNVRLLANSDNYVVVRINYTKDNIDSLPQIVEDLSEFSETEKSNINVSIHRVWQDLTLDDYEMINEKIKSITDTLIKNGIKVNTHFVLDSVRGGCYGNKSNYCLINYDGNVFLCTARNFMKEIPAGVLHDDGTIEWNKSIIEKHHNIRMSYGKCRTCRIAGICGGGCAQKWVETDHENSCAMGYSEENIDELVLDRLEYYHIR